MGLQHEQRQASASIADIKFIRFTSMIHLGAIHFEIIPMIRVDVNHIGIISMIHSDEILVELISTIHVDEIHI